MRNEILIVTRRVELAESVRSEILTSGYVVPAIATSSHFAIEAAIDFKPVAAFVDWAFSCELGAGELATALHGSLGIPVAFIDTEARAAPRNALKGCPWSADAILLVPPFAQGSVPEALRTLRELDAGAA